MVIVIAKRICMIGPVVNSLQGLKIIIAKSGTKRETRSRLGFRRAIAKMMKELMIHPHIPAEFSKDSFGIMPKIVSITVMPGLDAQIESMPIPIPANAMMGTDTQAYLGSSGNDEVLSVIVISGMD